MTYVVSYPIGEYERHSWVECESLLSIVPEISTLAFVSALDGLEKTCRGVQHRRHGSSA